MTIEKAIGQLTTGGVLIKHLGTPPCRTMVQGAKETVYLGTKVVKDRVTIVIQEEVVLEEVLLAVEGEMLHIIEGPKLVAMWTIGTLTVVQTTHNLANKVIEAEVRASQRIRHGQEGLAALLP